MNTEDKIEIMQAFVDGKPIEVRFTSHIGDWYTCVDPTWDWLNCEYRLKPDPLDSYIKDIKGICRIEGSEEVDSELRCVLNNFLLEQGNI